MKHLKKFENNKIDIKCVKVTSEYAVTYLIYVENILYTSNSAHIDSIGLIDEWLYGFNDGLKVFNNTYYIKTVEFESDIFDDFESDIYPSTYDDIESLINGKDMGLI